MKIFEKEYDGESLYDFSRDAFEALSEEYNPIIGDLPCDEHGFIKGTFKVTIEWYND